MSVIILAQGCVDKIRRQYTADLKSREMRVRQRYLLISPNPLCPFYSLQCIRAHRSVAMYFIDKLALRAGNEKDPDEAADTVGCCSLRVEHISEQPLLSPFSLLPPFLRTECRTGWSD